MDDVGTQNVTKDDYKAVTMFRDAVGPDGGLILVAHERKPKNGKRSKGDEDDDFFDAISGSDALNAAADGTARLKRNRGEKIAKLAIGGRVAPEAFLTLKFDTLTYRWVNQDPEAPVESEQRLDVLAAITQIGRPVSSKEVAATITCSDEAARQLLGKMFKAGQLAKPVRGRFAVRPDMQSQRSQVAAETR